MKNKCPATCKVQGTRTVRFDITVTSGPNRGEFQQQESEEKLTYAWADRQEYMQCDQNKGHTGKHWSTYAHFKPGSPFQYFMIEWDAPL